MSTYKPAVSRISKRLYTAALAFFYVSHVYQISDVEAG